MSALRLGRLPDGTRDIRVLEPAVGRITHARYGSKGGDEFVVPARVKAKFGDDSVRKNPDNGGVQAPITEVQP